MKIDKLAKSEVINRFVLPEELHVPIAVKSRNDLCDYVGEVIEDLSYRNAERAFLVKVNSKLQKTNLPIWDHPNSAIFHSHLQVWVHVDYRGYRKAYQKAFPKTDIEDKVLDHIMNRRFARLRKFKFLRIIPISQSANTSGAFGEKWGVDYNEPHNENVQREIAYQRIKYADLFDLVKMLDNKPGGGIMDVINRAQSLVIPPD